MIQTPYSAARVMTSTTRQFLVLGHRSNLGHADDIAFLAGVVGIVGVQLGRALDVLAVQRVLDLTLNQDGNRLVHLLLTTRPSTVRSVFFSVLSLIAAILTSCCRAGS